MNSQEYGMAFLFGPRYEEMKPEILAAAQRAHAEIREVGDKIYVNLIGGSELHVRQRAEELLELSGKVEHEANSQ